MEHGARQAGGHADGARPGRQRPLAAGVEQALVGELGLERLEAQREVAEARRLEAVDVQLVDALGSNTSMRPWATRRSPVRGWNGMAIRSSRKIMQRSWARSSLSVK